MGSHYACEQDRQRYLVSTNLPSGPPDVPPGSEHVPSVLTLRAAAVGALERRHPAGSVCQGWKAR